jgi:CDP-alcohol phosphatidyltransferase-like enzyme
MFRALRSHENDSILDRLEKRVPSERLTRLTCHLMDAPHSDCLRQLGHWSGWCLVPATTGYSGPSRGSCCFQFSVILDHVDGEMARLKFLCSRLAKWLDNSSDHAVNLAVIGLVIWRVARHGPTDQSTSLGAAAALGVTFAFLGISVIGFRGMPQAEHNIPDAASGPGHDFTRQPRWLLSGVIGHDPPGPPDLVLGDPLAVGANVYSVAWFFIYGLLSRSVEAIRWSASRG